MPEVALMRERVILQKLHLIRKGLIISRHHSAFAGRYDLICIKAEACRVADRAYLFAFINSSVSFCGILDNKKVMLFRDLHNDVHVTWMSVGMDGHYSFCSFCDFRFYL